MRSLTTRLAEASQNKHSSNCQKFDRSYRTSLFLAIAIIAATVAFKLPARWLSPRNGIIPTPTPRITTQDSPYDPRHSLDAVPLEHLTGVNGARWIKPTGMRDEGGETSLVEVPEESSYKDSHCQDPSFFDLPRRTSRTPLHTITSF